VASPELACQFDPFSLGFRQDPLAWHARLLSESPGFMTLEGIPSAYVATHEHNMAVLRDPKRFSSVKPPNLPGMERVDFFNGQPVMNYSDDPDHARRRKVVAAAFTPRRVQEISHVVQELIDELLEPIGPGATAEFYKQVCQPFGVRVMLGLFMNVAREDQPLFLNYVSTLPSLDQLRPGDPKPRAFLEAWEKGREYCRAAIEDARRTGAQSLIGLISSAQEGGALTDDEMMAMMTVLFTGGFPTIASAAASALYRLAENAELAERIRRDSTIAPKFLEECLRIDSPVTLVMRFAIEDVEIGGKIIRRGMPVYTMLSVANRDPKEFPDPARVDIDRPNLRHVAFGNGVHVCIGSAIARAAIPRLINTVAQRFPNLHPHPAQPIQWETTPRSRHMGRVCLST
jgi:cytochrome P450